MPALRNAASSRPCSASTGATTAALAARSVTSRPTKEAPRARPRRPVGLGVEVGEDDGHLPLTQQGGEGAAEAAGPSGDQGDVARVPRSHRHHITPGAGTGRGPGCRSAASRPRSARRCRGTARRSPGRPGACSGEKPKQRMPRVSKLLASVPPLMVNGTGRAPGSSAFSAATIRSTDGPSNVVSTAWSWTGHSRVTPSPRARRAAPRTPPPGRRGSGRRWWRWRCPG